MKVVHGKTDNEDDEWDHKISAGDKGPADCIRIDEVVAALKKMKIHKAPSLSGLAAGYAIQHIRCLSQARINREGCVRKGIRR